MFRKIGPKLREIAKSSSPKIYLPPLVLMVERARAKVVQLGAITPIKSSLRSAVSLPQNEES